jgi:hypothetical protein
MKKLMLTAVALAASGIVLAKLPPPDEATKAKAAEAAAKTAWQGKVDAYKLCQVQDRVAGAYKRSAAHRPAASATAGTTGTAAAAAGAAPAAAAAARPVPTAASASQGGSTPVPVVGTAAAPAATPCADPGPFAYAPPEQKPLETSGAHSPAANATSPPSVRPNSAEMAPSKAGVATKK